MKKKNLRSPVHICIRKIQIFFELGREKKAKISQNLHLKKVKLVIYLPNLQSFSPPLSFTSLYPFSRLHFSDSERGGRNSPLPPPSPNLYPFPTRANDIETNFCNIMSKNPHFLWKGAGSNLKISGYFLSPPPRRNVELMLIELI